MKMAQGLSPGPRRRRRWARVLWLAAGLGLFACGAALGLLSYLGTSITGRGLFGSLGSLLRRPFGGRQEVTILVLGVDNIGRGLADTVMVGDIQPLARRVAALSIPRDSRVEIPGRGAQRINSAHQFGGAELTKQAVERLLGIPIDYYVEVSTSGLQELVEAMGGVEIEVERRMRYRDRRGGLNIDLYPGRQRLDGEQAVGYVRFRHDAWGDLGRIERQQTFLREVARQLLHGRKLARLPGLARAFVKTVKTNLTVADLLSLRDIARELDPEKIPMLSLHGEPVRLRGAAMLQLDPAQTQRMVDQFRFAAEPTVEVLNGTGLEGLGAKVAEKLRTAGARVVSVENASRPSERTRVVDNVGRADRAWWIAGLLSCQQVVRAHPEFNQADISVIVGSDNSHLAEELPPPQASRASSDRKSPRPGWWARWKR
jgi:LCP family protein required for cell wall assembly